MEFYFTDRQYNLLGIASTERGRFRIAGEVEAQSTTASTVALTGNVYFAKKDLNDAINMCVGEGGNYILYEDDRGVGHFMTIQNTQVDNTGCSINFQSDDAGNDLKNEIVGTYTATKAMTFEQYFNLFCADSGWELGLNEIPTNTRTLEFTSEQTSYDRMLEVATDFGVSIYFSFEINGLEPVHRYLNVVNKLGSNTNVTLRQGTDISQIVSETSTADLHTSIKAYGATPDGKNAPLNLVGYKWTDSTGQFALGSDGVLRDTIAIRTWSRLRSNANPTPESSHLQMVKTYDATTQATLLQSALADLKTYNHPAVNYTVTMARVPAEVSKGDTVYCEDEAQDLYFSATVLEVDKCYSIPTASTLTLGDFKIEHDQTSARIKQVANQLKTLKQTAHWYPWTRYADDDQGAGISSLPLGKAYMAVVWGKTATPSDDPADYAGHWQKVTGADGADGIPGAKGADGRTPYSHIAWSQSADGSTGFSTTSADGATYLGTCSDFTEADPTDPSAYTWAKFVGPQGPAGKDITSYAKGTTLPTTVAPVNSQFWLVNAAGQCTAVYTSDGTKWVSTPISASLIVAATFKGMNFEGVTFTGSTFKTTYTNAANTVGDDGTKFTGTGTLSGPELVFNSKTNESTPQTVITSVAPDGFSAYVGEKAFGNLSAFGQMNLGDDNGNIGSLDAAGLKSMNITGSELWSGSSWPTDTTTLTPSVPLDHCLNGWALLWSGYNGTAAVDAGFCYTLISKRYVSLFSGKGLSCMVSDTSNISTKYIYVTNTTIKGYATNTEDLHAKFALRGVYAW